MAGGGGDGMNEAPLCMAWRADWMRKALRLMPWAWA